MSNADVSAPGVRASGITPIRFAVDNVTPAVERLPTQRLADLYPDAVCLGGDPDAEVIEPTGTHPVLGAVGRAFADHRPLVLSPDAIWLTIAQGLAQHIRLHAEELRTLLVEHTGRTRLTATIHEPVPTDAQSWARIVEQLATMLDPTLPGCDFSTSTDVERTASRIVLLDAYSPYYSFWLRAVCGIPEITLTGTVEDWQRIRSRIDEFDRFGLRSWAVSLRGILDHFVRAAESRADTEFWQRIYNPKDAYGGEQITGWITRLYPYLRGTGRADQPNPMLDLPLGEPSGWTDDNHRWYGGPGIRSNDVPDALSTVGIHVVSEPDRSVGTAALHAGLVAVAQDREGRLIPTVGWHLTGAGVPPIDDLIDRIIAEHETTPPVLPERPTCPPPSGMAEVIAIRTRIGTASLFGGAWTLYPAYRSVPAKLGSHQIQLIQESSASIGRGRLALLFDLPGGRVLGRLHRPWHHETWIVTDLAEPVELLDVGPSLAAILHEALDSGGEWEHMVVGRVDRTTVD